MADQIVAGAAVARAPAGAWPGVPRSAAARLRAHDSRGLPLAVYSSPMLMLLIQAVRVCLAPLYQ